MGINTEAIIALASGTLTLIVLGTIYTFGALTPYISSYLYYQNDPTTSAALSLLITITFVTVNLGVALSTIFFSNISNRIQCIIAVIGVSGSVFAASFMTNFVGILIFYGCCYGVCIGMGYFPPVKNCYLHLPSRKGLCSGICMCGFGLGSAIFNYIIVYLVNPDDVSVDPITKRYPPSVANNVPFALKILSATYLIVGLLGAIFIMPPK
jgi:MFS family permease